MNKLSGAEWVRYFPGKNSIDDLSPGFRMGVEKFYKALVQAGARVLISATLRPPERAYLMHWSWMIANRKTPPNKVPDFKGVNINWVHEYDSKSIAAAVAMVNAYGMHNLHVAPALNSRHTEGNAIDMNISWREELKINNVFGELVTISSHPNNGMNRELHQLARMYGVIKYHGGFADEPHWSNDGR